MKQEQNIESVLNSIGHLVYPIVGRSMYPLFKDGDNVSLTKQEQYFVNDIVIFRPLGRVNSYILHRIRKIEGDKYYILGDNSLKLDIVTKDQIFGKMDGVFKHTEYFDNNSEFVSTYNSNYIANPKIDIDDVINNLEETLKTRFDEAVKEITKTLVYPDYKVDINIINRLNGEEMDRLIIFLNRKKGLNLLSPYLNKLTTSICDIHRKQIEEANKKVQFRCLRINELENSLSILFDMHKIPYIFLKGSEIRKLYKNVFARQSNDVDLFISPVNYQKAKELILERYNAEMLPSESTYHDSFLIEQFKMNLEVHHNLIYGLPDDIKYLLEDPFDGATQDNDHPYRYHMDTSKYYLYHILHSAKHTANGETWLTMLSDTYVLNKKYQLDKDFIKKARIEKYEQVNLDIASYYFEDKPINDNEKQFLDYFYVDSKTSYISLQKGKHASKRSFIFSRVFVSKTYLVGLYPSILKYPYLMPIYQVRRWFRLFKKGELSNSIKELSSYNNHSNQVYSWLENNGLNEYLNK